jgi:hypothetical protein
VPALLRVRVSDSVQFFGGAERQMSSAGQPADGRPGVSIASLTQVLALESRDVRGGAARG